MLKCQLIESFTDCYYFYVDPDWSYKAAGSVAWFFKFIVSNLRSNSPSQQNCGIQRKVGVSKFNWRLETSRGIWLDEDSRNSVRISNFWNRFKILSKMHVQCAKDCDPHQRMRNCTSTCTCIHMSVFTPAQANIFMIVPYFFLNLYMWKIEFTNEKLKNYLINIFDYEGHNS